MNEKRKNMLRSLNSCQLLDLLKNDYDVFGYGESINDGYSLFANEIHRKRKCILEILLEREG